MDAEDMFENVDDKDDERESLRKRGGGEPPVVDLHQ